MEPDFLRDTRVLRCRGRRYAEWLRDELAAKPFDRAILAVFADLVRAAGQDPVADVGCGAGRVTAHLNELGLPAFGIDLSPQLVEVARQTYPGLRFEVGSMLAWYSTIHVPDDRLPEAFAEFYRVLVPGGYALLAFQVGHEPRHVTQALGQPVSVVLHQRQPDTVAGWLARAGLAVRARLIREPDDEGDFTERTQQAFLLARKVSPENL